MKHLTALSDQKYLPYGLALIESLYATATIPWTLHYYCVDAASYQTLNRLRLPNVVAYAPETLTSAPLMLPTSPEYKLTALRQSNFQEFCWTLASVFTRYILNKVACDSVTYVDSDIYFYKDIRLLFEKFGDKHCGIFRHRHFDLAKDYVEGHYNVGIVYFRNSTLGRRLLNWWADAVLSRSPSKYATCGDQKFLEFFPTVCAPSELYVDEGIGHGASWQWEIYDLSRLADGVVIWKGEPQELVFNHFSRFQYNIEDMTFTSSWFKPDHIIWSVPALCDLHTNYVHALKRAHERIQK
jgi:hypothetical protein